MTGNHKLQDQLARKSLWMQQRKIRVTFSDLATSEGADERCARLVTASTLLLTSQKEAV
jgi:hypothetical protein